MFTKQHYKAIAEIIKEKVEYAKAFTGTAFTVNTCLYIAEDLADYFTKDNSQFDHDKFLEACGL